MPNRRSIRFRLTVWYAVVLLVGLGLFSGLLWFSLRSRLISDVDRELAERAGRFQHFFLNELSAGAKESVADELNEFCQALPAASFVRLSAESGYRFQYPAALPAAPGDSRSLVRRFAAGGDNFVLELSTPTAEVAHTMNLLGMLLLSLTPAVIVIACIGGAWLSGRALRPVEDMTRAAHAISIENLTERLPVPGTGDELARLTEVLNSMLGRLESAVRTLSQFSADASHELRTPLAVIRTTAELALRRDRTPESYRESLRGVTAEAERMTRLIEDMLILARSGTTAVEMPSVPLDAAALLQDVCEEVRPLAELRGIRIDCRLELNHFPLLGNKAALHRLFLSLVDNAVKFSPDGATVTLDAQADNDALTVSVQDRGKGIADADLPHIFERFYRAERNGGSGYGLGLALADMIAKAHGATIAVRSAVNEGSTFRVTFPPRKVPSALANPQIDWLSYRSSEEKEFHS